MIKSMTGYGSATAVRSGREISVEIRSVNNRYFDCSVRIPRAYAFAEDAVKRSVKGAITRGKIDLYISVVNLECDETKISLNRPLLEGYLNALRGACRDYALTDDLSASSISRLPDIFLVEKSPTDEQAITEDILQVTASAVSAYDAMRTKEGAALASDLCEKADRISELVSAVEERSPITLREYRERLTAKMKETLENTDIDEARILQEAAIYADRIAVDEETVRLRSHIAQLKQLLHDGGAIGKTLDFLLQEMNREANTIGSKGNDLQQARTVVAIKSELEKIREQIQNIE